MTGRLRLPLLVFAVACLVRVAAIAWFPGFDDDPSAQGDAIDYHALAVHMTQGRGYTLAWQGGGAHHGELRFTALRPPVWPLTLAALYEATGVSPGAARLLLVALDAATCALLVVLGRILAGPKVGAVAGFAAAAYPPLWINVFRLHSDVLFTLIIVAALCIAERLRQRPGARVAAAFGLVLGLLTLTRPNGVFLAAVLAAWLGSVAWRALRAGAVPVMAAAASGVLLLVVPWVALASARVGAFVPITTQGGPVLAGYYSPRLLDYGGTNYWGAWDVDRVGKILHAAPDEATYLRRGQQAGLHFIRDHPGGAGELVGLHALRYFDLYWQQGGRLPLLWFPSVWRGANVLAVLAWWIAAPLALVGLWRVRAAPGRWAPALLVFATLAASSLLLGATPRLRSPSEPVVLLLAAVAVVGLTPGDKNDRRGLRAA